jgi:hypothetical protein
MADKYSLQFQLGTTLDSKGLQELKKQLKDIGLEGITINSKLSKLTDKQLKNHKDTNKSLQKRLTIEEGYLSLQRKQYNSAKKQRVLDNIIASDKRKNNGETIASLKKQNELKIISEKLDQKARRITQRERSINLKYLPQKNEASLGYNNARTGVLISRQGQIIANTQGQNLKNAYAAGIYQSGINLSNARTANISAKTQGQNLKNSYSGAIYQSGIDLTNARTANTGAKTEGVNLANSFIAGTKQAIIRKINTGTNLIGEKLLGEKLKNTFLPYINFFNLRDKQAKIDLSNAKIQDIKDKKSEREQDRAKKEIASLQREQRRAIREAEKAKLQNFYNKKNSLYSKANLLESVANPLLFGYSLPATYYFGKSVTSSAVNSIERENQMEMLFGNKTPEMMRFAKQYAKETPIGLQEAVDLISRIKGSQESLGISDDQVKTFAKGVGDFSLVFGRGKQGRDSLIYQLGQIADKGVPQSAQDIRPIYDAGGGVIIDRALRKKYGMSLVELQDAGKLDRKVIFDAIGDIISADEFKQRVATRKVQLPGQLDELSTSLELLQESIGKSINKMFGVGEKASRFAKSIDEFADSVEKGKGGSTLIAGLIGLAGAGAGLYGLSKFARIRANYFASKGFDKNGIDKDGKKNSILMSTPAKILGLGMTGAAIYGSWDSIKSGGAKAIEGFKEHSKDNPIFGIFQGIKNFVKEVGAVDTVMLFAGLGQGLSILVSGFKELPMLFTRIGGSFKTILSVFGRGLGIPALLGFAGYEAGKFAINSYNSGKDSEEIKKTKEAGQFWENMKGMSPQQKREYIQNIDVTNLDSGSRDVVKSLMTAYDHRASQSPHPSVKSAQRKSKNDPNKTPYVDKTRVCNPKFQSCDDSKMWVTIQ